MEGLFQLLNYALQESTIWLLVSKALEFLTTKGYLNGWGFGYLLATAFLLIWGFSERHEESGKGVLLMVLSGIMFVGFLFLAPLLLGDSSA